MDNEVARAKWLLIGVVVLLISGCISYGEVAYYLNGHDADADITKAYESRSRRGRTRLTVEYAFTEPDGTRRTGQDTVSTSSSVPRAGKVPVRYTPGEGGSSRLAGQVNWVGLALFAISAGCVAIFGIRLLLEGASEPKPRRRDDV